MSMYSELTSSRIKESSSFIFRVRIRSENSYMIWWTHHAGLKPKINSALFIFDCVNNLNPLYVRAQTPG